MSDRLILPEPIPKCAANRAETGSAYCVSAYCDRCAVLREIHGVPPVIPNAWMIPDLVIVPPMPHDHYFKYDQERGTWYCIAENCEAEHD